MLSTTDMLDTSVREDNKLTIIMVTKLKENRIVVSRGCVGLVNA